MSMAVSQTKDVSEDGDSGCGAGVSETAFKPFVWVLKAFHEEVAEDGVKVFDDFPEDVNAFLCAFGLSVGDVLAAGVGFEVFGEVALMGGDEVFV